MTVGATLEWLSEQLEILGPLRIKRMFGGAGLFASDVMFALEIDGAAYFKVDNATRPDFEAAGSEPFIYRTKVRTVATSYWRVPDHLLDEPDELVEWGGRALAAARREAAAKPAKRRKKKPEE